MFRCESDGYESIVFGEFDGVTTWTAHAYINRGSTHQEVVSAHEERHLRLQKGTPWGVLLILLALGGDEQRLLPLVEACRRTHESYATYLSTVHVEDGLDAIIDNPVYLDYWRTAAEIVDEFDPDGPTPAILEYLFHLTMSPAVLADETFDGDLDELLTHGPDRRLVALTGVLHSSPELVDTIAAAVGSRDNVEDTQDRLAAVLTECGLPTLSTAEQLLHATRMVEAFNASSATYQVHVTDRSRATSLLDQLDHQQYEVLRVHRAPVRLEIGSPPMGDGLPHPFTDFVMDDEHLGPHVWGVVLSAPVLARQFVLTSDLLDERYWGWLAVDRRTEDSRARLWPLPDSPAMVTEKLAEAGIQSVLMTTMSTLFQIYRETLFSPSPPVFVLVDLPVLPFLEGLLEGGVAVNWTHAYATGDLEFHFLLLALPGPDPLYYVIVRSAHTVKSTVEWISRQEGFEFQPDLTAPINNYLFALMQHLAGTFWEFDTSRTNFPSATQGS